MKRIYVLIRLHIHYLPSLASSFLIKNRLIDEFQFFEICSRKFPTLFDCLSSSNTLSRKYKGLYPYRTGILQTLKIFYVVLYPNLRQEMRHLLTISWRTAITRTPRSNLRLVSFEIEDVFSLTITSTTKFNMRTLDRHEDEGNNDKTRDCRTRRDHIVLEGTADPYH